MGNLHSALKVYKKELAALDSRIQTFHSSARFKLHLNNLKHTSHLVVINFFTWWCGPVKLDHMAMRYLADVYFSTDVEFIRIEFNELLDVSNEFQVQAPPTFVLLKKGKEVDRVFGPWREELRMKIEKHRALQA